MVRWVYSSGMLYRFDLWYNHVGILKWVYSSGISQVFCSFFSLWFCLAPATAVPQFRTWSNLGAASWTLWMARVTTELDESRRLGELPSIETILQKIGTELSIEREIQREASSSLSKAAAQLFTGQLCGTARVHWLVSCAYIACPLSSLLVLVVATEAWWEIGDLEFLVVSRRWTLYIGGTDMSLTFYWWWSLMLGSNFKLPEFMFNICKWDTLGG